MTACKNEAIIQTEAGFDTDREKCKNCGDCASACPTGARRLIGRPYGIDEVMEAIERDAPFYWRSGGGVTITGGELLLQPVFVKNLLHECKKNLFHTAIETSACGKWPDLEQVLEFTDVVFIDIKHINPPEHKRLTGVSNKEMLENIKRASEFCRERSKQLILRIPLVPGYNDTQDNIRDIAHFVKGLKAIPEINLLPYHNLGQPKYEWLDQEYPLKDIETSNKESLTHICRMIESEGITCSIGGGKVKTYS
jgi:pyruvate formate lyase activating enzyme